MQTNYKPTRGRKRGKALTPSKGSWNEWLCGFSEGERRYLETTEEGYPQMMRSVNTPQSRRPPIMAGMQFSCQVFTAVSNSKVGDVRILICVERVA